jgi:hypothetical protein
MVNIKRLFTPDYDRYDGVRPVHVFVMRVGMLLVATMVGAIAWPGLIQHQGDWDPMVAAAVSMWAACSALSVLGIVNPIRWIPLALFEIAYKTIWLAAVAYPLWAADRLAGSPAEEMTYMFLAVVFPIAGMPWVYVWRTYVWRGTAARKQPGASLTASSA